MVPLGSGFCNRRGRIRGLCMDNKRLSVVQRTAFQLSYFEKLNVLWSPSPLPAAEDEDAAFEAHPTSFPFFQALVPVLHLFFPFPSLVSCATRSLQPTSVTCTSLFCAAGYHSSWARNGVPHRKPHRDGTDADGGHPREGFRIQSV